MRSASLSYLLAGSFHRLAWTEWGPVDGAPVLCVHGLTRNGRDFDPLAQALAAKAQQPFRCRGYALSRIGRSGRI